MSQTLLIELSGGFQDNLLIPILNAEVGSLNSELSTNFRTRHLFHTANGFNGIPRIFPSCGGAAWSKLYLLMGIKIFPRKGIIFMQVSYYLGI